MAVTHVSNHYYDPSVKAFAIDVWRTNNQTEEGITVALVFSSKYVDVLRPEYVLEPMVKEAIEDAKANFINRRTAMKQAIGG